MSRLGNFVVGCVVLTDARVSKVGNKVVDKVKEIEKKGAQYQVEKATTAYYGAYENALKAE